MLRAKMFVSAGARAIAKMMDSWSGPITFTRWGFNIIILFICAAGIAQESGRGISGGGACVSSDGRARCQLLDYAEYVQNRPAYFFPMIDSEVAAKASSSLRNFGTRCLSYRMGARTHETSTILDGAVHALGHHYFPSLKNQIYISGREYSAYRRKGEALNELVWVYSRVTPLERLNDEGIIRYTAPVGRQRIIKQIAVQKNGVVLVDRALYNQLSKDERAGLGVHEAILSDFIARRPWTIMKHGTSFIRDIVGFISDPDFSKLPQVLADQRCGVNSYFMNDSLEDVLSFIEDPRLNEHQKVYHLLFSDIIEHSFWERPAPTLFNSIPERELQSRACLRANRISMISSPRVQEERDQVQDAMRRAGFSNLCRTM